MKLSAQSHPLLWQTLPQFEAALAQSPIRPGPTLVGMSGGVDSSVTALVLKALGQDVAGLFMKNWDEDDGTDYCTAKRDLADAVAVADQLQIPLHTANFAAEYWDNVFEDFIASYTSGFTPNPDVLCNREIKFQVFRDYAQALGFANIATGHYAVVKSSSTGPELHRAIDENKDQTYFLTGVAAHQFQNVVFPLGVVDKPLVRQLAAEAHLATRSKKDSTGICFIGERRFKDFLQTYIPAQPGIICDDHEKSIGQHQGLMYYTLGQRKGIGVGGLSGADEKPWYVARKCLATNRLFITQDPQHPWLMSHSAELGSINWITPPSKTPWHGQARYRHRQPLISTQSQSPLTSQQPVFIFDQPAWAVAPGQYLVLYSGTLCLGGGPVVNR